MVPGPKIAAVERREARHPISGVSHAKQIGFASLSVARDKLLVRRSALRSLGYALREEESGPRSLSKQRGR